MSEPWNPARGLKEAAALARSLCLSAPSGLIEITVEPEWLQIRGKINSNRLDYRVPYDSFFNQPKVLGAAVRHVADRLGIGQ